MLIDYTRPKTKPPSKIPAEPAPSGFRASNLLKREAPVSLELLLLLLFLVPTVNSPVIGTWRAPTKVLGALLYLSLYLLGRRTSGLRKGAAKWLILAAGWRMFIELHQMNWLLNSSSWVSQWSENCFDRRRILQKAKSLAFWRYFLFSAFKKQRERESSVKCFHSLLHVRLIIAGLVCWTIRRLESILNVLLVLTIWFGARAISFLQQRLTMTSERGRKFELENHFWTLKC